MDPRANMDNTPMGDSMPDSPGGEQIFVLRTIIILSLEYQKRLSIHFIDFTKAFGSVHHETLWKITLEEVRHPMQVY